jgi:DNA-nicking Smr family endonuclease
MISSNLPPYNYTSIQTITHAFSDAVKRTLPPDESALFRDAVRDVRPRPAVSNRVTVAKPKPRIRRQRVEPAQLDAEPALLSSSDELSFRRNDITHSVWQRLRRGDYVAAAEMDLHGLTAKQACKALAEFINEALQYDYRCVRIIHGKGYRCVERAPVLKNQVNSWLRQCHAVAAFCSARAAAGGSGAVLVLLQSASY